VLDALALSLLGLLLGVRHAVDPDHVIAVSTITAREPSIVRATRIGALWGFGHSLTILLVGGVIVVFRLAVPPRVSVALELVVAGMLIALGFLNLIPRTEQAPPPNAARPVLIGMVHGLAGSAAVALLVLAAVRDTGWAIVYLLLFGVGTVIGMMIATLIIAVPTSYALARAERARRVIRMASGVVSVAFGILLAVRLTAGEGLMAAVSSWMR
jgi:high-affinity nickel-transport protein